MAYGLTQKLTAVNTMLSAIGESPVNQLGSQAPADAVLAEQILDETAKEIQGEGWHFNSHYDWNLVRDGDDKIPLPDNTVRVDIPKGQNFDVDIIQRGGFLYDRKNNTAIFTSDVDDVDIVFMLDWDELPEVVRRYVTIKAARVFGDRTLGSNQHHTFTMQDEMRALATLREYETDTADLTIFDHSDVSNTLERGPFQSRVLK
jgi:hypothetical protein